LTVIVVGFDTSIVAAAAGEPLSALAGLVVAGDVVAGDVVVEPLLLDDESALGLLLLLQPATVTTPATASIATTLWYFIKRSLLGCRFGAGPPRS